LNSVSKWLFFLIFLDIQVFVGSVKSWKNSYGGPGKVLDFFSVKEWEPCIPVLLHCCCKRNAPNILCFLDSFCNSIALPFYCGVLLNSALLPESTYIKRDALRLRCYSTSSILAALPCGQSTLVSCYKVLRPIHPSVCLLPTIHSKSECRGNFKFIEYLMQDE